MGTYHSSFACDGPVAFQPLPVIDSAQTSGEPKSTAEFSQNERSGGENRTLRVAIEGMHCAGCADQVRTAIRALPHVASAEVNFATHLATVIGRDTSPNELAVVAAIERLGYSARPQRTPEAQAINLERFDVEIHGWLIRTAIAGVAALCILLIHNGTIGGHHDASNVHLPDWSKVITWLLSASAVAFSGGPFFRGARKAVQTGRANMDVLIALGAGVAFAAGTLDLIAGRGVDYLHEATVVLTFVCLGSYLETWGRRHAAGAISQLALSRNAVAQRRSAQGEWRTVPVAEVQRNDVLLVKPGDRIPLDGKVVSGRSHVDESWLTGESLPVNKSEGDQLLAGSVNGDGSLELQVSAASGATMWDDAMHLVMQAQSSRPKIQRIADTVMSYFVPVLLLLALGAALFWGVQGDWPRGVNALVAVVVVTCPCAVGLAAPLAVMTASGKAAREGILVKSAEAFETAAQLRSITFDKTGTLTMGKPTLVRVLAAAGHREDEVIQLAASLEQLSRHPLAQGVVAAAQARKLDLYTSNELKVVPGMGVQGRVNTPGGERHVAIGSEELMRNLNVSLPVPTNAQVSEQGEQRLFLAVAGEYAGELHLRDELSPYSSEVVKALQKQGLQTLLLSGDRQAIVRQIADKVGIVNAEGDLLPADKYARLKEFRKSGPLAMVGDGLNDAPALAGADLGVAMSGGADIALAAAHVILTGHDLRKLTRLLQISRAVVRVIWQNLGWAFFYNLLAVPLAASGALPAWVAAAAMSASSVSVVLNSQRLRWC